MVQLLYPSNAVADTISPEGDALEPPNLNLLSYRNSDHANLVTGYFWRQIPVFRGVSEQDFLCHKWQFANSITKIADLDSAVGELAPKGFIKDVETGLSRAPMSLRISPYILSLIDWKQAISDPLRRQFIPLDSELLPDHPMVGLDSLHEMKDLKVPGVIHRYSDKALFLALDHCPVYCRFCTRSYAVGKKNGSLRKIRFGSNPVQWKHAFQYLSSHPEVEDVVVSGGDIYHLKAEQIRYIGSTLLNIPHIRRIRLGTRGLAVAPMKVLSDESWFRALVDVANLGRVLHKQVAVHTHIAHPNEITDITHRAMERLFENSVVVRNQFVLMRDVNDDVNILRLLIKRLSYINIHPYYVYQHDLVPGVEDLRTTLGMTLNLEKQVRGLTSGFNTPTFVIDAPGGGGKRDIHSFEYYDRVSGISIYRAPCIDKEALYLYFDPLHLLPDEGRMLYEDSSRYSTIIQKALAHIRVENLPSSVLV